MRVLGKPVVRAAVYTRKSSDEGLDQEFNSLDAQYEACSAYIASQRHEGWKLIKKRFDDGGISGGTLERPALSALLADVESGLIDMIVVYKIDRLTRSLSDFANKGTSGKPKCEGNLHCKGLLVTKYNHMSLECRCGHRKH